MTIAIDSIRTLALVGHGGAGKTMLAEALLQTSGAVPAAGTFERGGTICDSDPLEKEFGHSLNSALVNFEHDGVRTYLIDTPGYPDFLGQSIAALDAVDTVLIVIDAQKGIEPVAERMMDWAAARGLCRMVVINKIDGANANLGDLVADLRARFGPECKLLDLPAADHDAVIELIDHDGEHGEPASDVDSVAHAHRELIDQLVEEDEDLLARYLDDGADPAPAELHAPFEKALRAGHLVPILFTSARTGAGIGELLHVIDTLAPSPLEGNRPRFFSGDPGTPDVEDYAVLADPGRHVVAHVFKVQIDPYMGRIGMFRVHQGIVRKDMQLFVGEAKRAFKVAHLYRVQGKDLVECDELVPGELGAVAKVEELAFDAVLHDSHDEDHIHRQTLDFPQPMHGLAVETQRKGDEQRLFDVLGKLAAEDPCFRVERHPTQNETVIRGLGELHLRVKLARMAGHYKLEVDTHAPSIPYRETISRPAEGHCRHKKQSGGAGQFGEVYLRVEPRGRGEGFEFVDSVKGGVIPGVFMPAVQKGVEKALADGVIAGFPVVDLRVTVHDGKTHPVDGKEAAFFAAGRKAAIAAIQEAAAIVLEPIVRVEVDAPESAMGDLSADLSTRRGHVTGTDARGRGRIVIRAEVPLAEMGDYATRLKSLTGDQATFSLDFAHYGAAQPATQKALMSQFRPSEDD